MIINQVGLLLGIEDTESDELLNTLVDLCKDEAYAYCNLPEYDEKLDGIVVKMVIQAYNRLGTEGVAAQSFSGVSESFIDGYTLDIKTALNKHRRIKLL